ncbi:ROK family protein [Candidatus Bathyarchaeota archaeon]|nr:ROK family protein [Candidatus Bathyarchaeota archaeon]
MTEKLAIGIDLGGTNVRVALGNSDGRILKKIYEKTDKSRGPEGISKQIIRMINSLVSEETSIKKIEGIGIGSAGPLDIKKGGLMKPTNFPFDFVPLVKPLEEEYGLPTYLLNDCVAAVIGEKHFGLGRNHDNLVYITISTGIGGGIYVDEHLLIGKDGNAHEIGHFTIDFEGRLICGCGRRGHWEAYCSGNGIPNYSRLIIEEEGLMKIEGSNLIEEVRRNGYAGITAKAIYNYAKAGDKIAELIVERIGVLNAIGFACVVDAYDPTLITVGGSIALNNPNLVVNPIKQHIGEHARNRIPEIKLTPLRGDAVLYGALASVFHQEEIG